MTDTHIRESEYAAELARRLFSVKASVNDLGKVQKAPDVILEFPDGSIGMLELTKYGYKEDFELEAILKDIGYKFDPAGKHMWLITVDRRTNFSRLKSVYKRIIELCELYNAFGLNELPWWIIKEDEDVLWLRNTGTNFLGNASPSSIKEDCSLRSVHVLPKAISGLVAHDWSNLKNALLKMFNDPGIVYRCKKLLESDASFRCLMVICGRNRLPFEIADLLNFGNNTPPPIEPPPLPKGIDSLVLVPLHPGQTLVWINGNWKSWYPWDN